MVRVSEMRHKEWKMGTMVERIQPVGPSNLLNNMHHATKRGFKDCPGFLNSTGRLGPKRGRKCYVTPAFSGVPNKGDEIRSQNLCRGSP